MTNPGTDFLPDWVSPPGETILDLIEERDWNQTELARRLGFSTKHLNQLIKGKTALTEDAALRLERVLGSTANFWLNREAKYREHRARLQARERYQSWVGWLDLLPLPELKKAGIIPNERITARNKPALVEILLEFFSIASPDEWQAHYGAMQESFRRTRETQSDNGAIASWLRLGEIAAEKLESSKFDKTRFIKALSEIRQLTILPPEIFEPELRRLCFEAGITFVMVPAIPRAHVSGVARWLNNHRPLIQLSLYGKTNDKFWFTFFHEAAHLLLHSKQKKTIYLDDPNKYSQDTLEEREANRWAGDFLIPSQYSAALTDLRNRDEVRHFAKQLNIHSGIVVGRLQHDQLIAPSWMNDLKASFRFSDSEM